MSRNKNIVNRSNASHANRTGKFPRRVQTSLKLTATVECIASQPTNPSLLLPGRKAVLYIPKLLRRREVLPQEPLQTPVKSQSRVPSISLPVFFRDSFASSFSWDAKSPAGGKDSAADTATRRARRERDSYKHVRLCIVSVQHSPAELPALKRRQPARPDSARDPYLRDPVIFCRLLARVHSCVFRPLSLLTLLSL